MSAPPAELRTLGSFALSAGGKSVVAPPTQKGRALLLYLVANRATAQSRERLLELFWPDSDADKARQSFNTALWTLRKNFREAGADPDAYLSAGKLTVQWVGPVEYDVDRFETLARSVSETKRQDALSLYTGDFLEGDFEEWTVSERERLSALYETLAESQVERHRNVDAAKALLLRNPFNEKAYDVLIDAARRAGRLQLAKSLYARAKSALAELGVPASAEFSQNYESLLGARVATPNNLPVFSTSFIGREGEIAELCDLLESSALVTICGTGGIGKTRLAVEVAKSELELFADGVYFVALAPVTDPALVPDALATALDLPQDVDVVEAFAERYAGKHALVILDNCEHVLSATAQLIAALKERLPEMRVLTTTREPLGLAVERTYRLAPLRPGTASGLFIERAKLRDDKFTVTNENMEALTALVARLDGIPLAIELAASRMNVLGVPQLLERLERSFHLLKSSERGTVPRHRTLHATIDWSYQALMPKERAAFIRLGVFAGPFGIDAAAAVCELDGDAIVNMLDRLVEKSLVVSVDHDGARRFYLLETIRAFALEALEASGQADRTGEAHAQFFASFVEAGLAQRRSVDSAAWVRYYSLELENIRQAFAFARGANVASIVGRLACATDLFWNRSGRIDEGLQVMAAALAQPGALEGSARMQVYRAASAYARGTTQYALSVDYAMAGLRYCEETELPETEIANLNTCLASALIFAGQPERVESLYRQAIEIQMRHKNYSDAAASTFNLSYYLMSHDGDSDEIEACIKEGLRLDSLENADDLFQQAMAHEVLSNNEINRGDYEKAIVYLEKSCEYYRKLDNHERYVGAVVGLVNLYGFAGNGTRAREVYDEIAADVSGSLSVANEINVLEAVAPLAYAEGRYEDSVRTFSFLLQNDERRGIVRFPIEKRRFDSMLATLKAKMGDAAFERAWTKGRTLSMREALAVPEKAGRTV